VSYPGSGLRIVTADDEATAISGQPFSDSGKFYFVPDVDPVLVRDLRPGETLAPKTARGIVGYKDVNGKVHTGVIEIDLTDETATTPGYSQITLQGSVGDSSQTFRQSNGTIISTIPLAGENRPLDVYRVQQRLRYLGYPGWGGTLDDPVPQGLVGYTGGGSVSSTSRYPDREFGVDFEVNGRVTADRVLNGVTYQDPFIEALKLFQATVNTSGVPASQRGNPYFELLGTRGGLSSVASRGLIPNASDTGYINQALKQQDLRTLDWLNANNAPGWRSLATVGENYRFSGWFSYIRNQPGNTFWFDRGDDESFGTTWAVDLLKAALDAQDAGGNHRVVGMSNYYADSAGNMFHATHKAGMDIDFMTDGDRDYWDGLQVIQNPSSPNLVPANATAQQFLAHANEVTLLSKRITAGVLPAATLQLIEDVRSDSDLSIEFYLGRPLKGGTADPVVAQLNAALAAAGVVVNRLNADEIRVAEDILTFQKSANSMGVGVVAVTSWRAIAQVVNEIGLIQNGVRVESAAHKDHVHFHLQAPQPVTPTLDVRETSGISTDRLAFYIDDGDHSPARLTAAGDPLASETSDIIRQYQRNTHQFTVHNTFSQTIQVNVEIGRNWFLTGVLADGITPDASAAYNDDSPYSLSTLTIAPGASASFRLAAQINIEEAKQHVEDAWLTGTKIRFSALVGGVMHESDVDVYYLADLGDQDRDDGILQFATTAIGSTRTLSIRNDTDLTLDLVNDPLGVYATPSIDGPEMRITYNPTVGSSAPATGIVEIKRDGVYQSQVRLEAESVAPQVVKLSLAELEAEIRALYEVVADFKQSGSSSARQAVLDQDPRAFKAAFQLADSYERFYTAFSTGSLDANVAKFLQAVKDGLAAVYGSFYQTGLRFDFSADPAADHMTYYVAQDDSTIAQASSDKTPRGLFGATGVFEGTLHSITPTTPWTIRDDLTPASLAFRLGEIQNRDPSVDIDVFLGRQITAEGSKAPTAPFSPERFGRALGLTIAHEFSHSLGFFDEYERDVALAASIAQLLAQFTASASMGNPSASFMSTDQRNDAGTGLPIVDVTEFHRAFWALALKDGELARQYLGGSAGNPDVMNNFIAAFQSIQAYDYYNTPGTYAGLKTEGEGATDADVEPGDGGRGLPALVPVMVSAQFAPSAPSADAWSVAGSVRIDGTRLTLDEGDVFNTRASRLFVAPTGARALSFKILDADFDAVGATPQDAFEVALLDPDTMDSLLGSVGLTETDALLNAQADGSLYRSAGVTLTNMIGGALPSDIVDPVVVTIDLSGIDVSGGVALYFDLLGFGDLGSRIVIDDVRFLLDGENSPPNAVGDSVATDEDVPILIDVLANDTDVDGNPLSITAVGTAGHGTVVIESGKLRYTPNENFFGTDSFTYDISDGFGGVSSAQVDITIASVNDDPVAQDDTAITFRNTPVAIDVLANDSDVDGGTLMVTGATGATHGSLAIVENKVLYTPNADFAGDDTFVYSIVDGQGGGAAADVAVTIRVTNRVPEIVPVPGRTVEEGDTVDLVVLATDPDGDAVTFSLVGGPAGASIDATTGAFSWTPADDAPTPFGFTVRATDVLGEFSEASFSIDVVNAPPAILAIGAVSVIGGTPYNLELLSADPGDDTVVQWEVDWGDGTIELLPVATGTPSSVYGHTYTRAGGNFDIKVAAIDEDGTFDAPDVLSVTVLPDFLSVESFTATATGFQVRFDHAFDPSRINLAVGPGQSAADTDIEIVGDLVGAVSGNVVLDADNRGFTFARTNGRALQFDRYRLTLGSGDEAFRDQVGALDGNADGIAGDDYVTEFDVRGTGTGAFSLPDFMRGPGQAVNVPAVAQGLPVRFASDGTVRLLVFSIDYDPRLITLTDAAPATGLPTDATVRFSTEVINGTQVRATITIVSDMPIPAGNVTLVNVAAFVPSTAPYASREALALKVRAINGDDQATATAGGGLHVAGYLGDVDGNGKLNDSDVTRLARYVSGMAPATTTFSAWTGINPLLVADINGDGRINALDVNLIANEVRGINRPEVPDVPAGLLPILGAPIVSNPDASAASPSSQQRVAAATQPSVDWNATYNSFSLTAARRLEPAKTPDWADEPWARDLTARLSDPAKDGLLAGRNTFGGVIRTLSRGLARLGR
jgi:hypothetical protein